MVLLWFLSKLGNFSSLTRVFLTDEGAPYGVDINTGGIADSYANFVWEPSVVKVSVCNLYIYLFNNKETHVYAVRIFCGIDTCDADTFNFLFFWQINAINAATEAACLVLSVDETVKNPKVRE